MLYLDNAAALPPLPEMVDFFGTCCAKYFANQEAGHHFAYQVRQELQRAGQQISMMLTNSPDYRVIWGNSASELFALWGQSPWVQGKRCYFTPFEHPALQAALRHGQVVKTPDSAQLVAGSAVQSELGKFTATAELFAAAPAGAVQFLDAVQLVGKLPLIPEKVDVIALSGVKFGAPGGAALLIRPDWSETGKVVEYFHLARSRDYLAGRPSPPLLLTLAETLKVRQARLKTDLERMTRLNLQARDSLEKLGFRPTLAAADSSPYILHLMLPGMQSAVVVRQLSEYGVMCASGSACAAESRQPSPALLARGFSRSAAYSGLRLSFGFDFSVNDWEFFLEQFQKALKNY